MILPEVPLAGALLLAFPASVPPERRQLLILAGYFDESGTHDAAEAIAVAGYLSTPERWEMFEQEWKKALADFDGLPFFHMVDFANNAPPYYNTWTPEQKIERYDRLAKIINDHVLFSVGCCFLTASYRSIFSAKAQRTAGGPYGVLATSCFLEAGEFVRERHPGSWIRYFFEDGAEGAGEVLKKFQHNVKVPKRREYYRSIAISFEDKRLFAPLQAADILAYELYRHLPRQLGIDQRPGTRRELEALAVPPRRWRGLNDKNLATWARVADVHADFQRLSKAERGKLMKLYPPWRQQ